MMHALDITKEHCPMTMVKVKLKLAQLQNNDLLEVLLKDGEPLNNVPRTAKEEGHKILSIEPAGPDFRVTIKKQE